MMFSAMIIGFYGPFLEGPYVLCMKSLKTKKAWGGKTTPRLCNLYRLFIP